jgi:hypothetical protein
MRIVKEAVEYWWAIAIAVAICWPGIKKMVRTGQKPFKERQQTGASEESDEGEYEPGVEASLGALPATNNE